MRNGRLRLEGVLLTAALALSACAVGRPRDDAGAANPRPENYKSDILAMLHVYLRVCPKTSGGITKFSEHEAD